MQRSIILSFLLFLSTVAQALTEQEFIQKVIKLLDNNKSLETSKIDVQIKQLELDSSAQNYVNWKLNFELGLGYDYQDTNKQTTSNSTYDKKKITYDKVAEITATKRWLHNPSSLGIKLSAKSPNAGIERYKQDFHASTYHTNNDEHSLSIAWKYPLLKHDSNASSLKTYQRNIYDLEKQKLAFYEDKEDFLVERLQDYLSWAEQQQKVDILQSYLQILSLLKSKNYKQKLSLKGLLQQTQNDILDAKEELKSIKKSLSITLNDTGLFYQKIKPNFDKSVAFIDDLKHYLQANSRDLHKRKIDEILKQIDINYYQNQDLPRLDFYFSVNKLLTQGNTQASIYDNDKLSYDTNLLFAYPLSGNLSNHTNLNIAKLNLKKLRIKSIDKLQDLYAQLSGLNISLKSNQKSLERHVQLIQLAGKKSAVEHQYLQLNKTTFNSFLSALDDEKQTKIEHIETLIKHQRQRLDYDNLLDRIIIYQPKLSAITWLSAE